MKLSLYDPLASETALSTCEGGRPGSWLPNAVALVTYTPVALADVNSPSTSVSLNVVVASPDAVNSRFSGGLPVNCPAQWSDLENA